LIALKCETARAAARGKIFLDEQMLILLARAGFRAVGGGRRGSKARTDHHRRLRPEIFFV
jgi:hypothetical protein